MTHRDNIDALIKHNSEALSDIEYRNVCQLLYGITYDADVVGDLLVRDAATDGAFLLQGERDSLLHVLNGGAIDDVVANN